MMRDYQFYPLDNAPARKKIMVRVLRTKWLTLRHWKISSSVLVDYRILQNYAHRLLKALEKKA